MPDTPSAPTVATTSALNPRVGVEPVTTRPAGPKISVAPASPARAPAIKYEDMRMRAIARPCQSAADGFVPV